MKVTYEYFEPKVGMMSLVGIIGGNFPLSFGNYFSLEGGPYIANFWAENLEEWVNQNPDCGKIKVAIVNDKNHSIGVIVDERLQDWANKKLCVTGQGWGTVEICKKVEEITGIDSDRLNKNKTEFLK